MSERDVPSIWLDMFRSAATSRHVWADYAWRLRRVAMMVWHLSQSEAEFVFHDTTKSLMTPRGETNDSLRSVFMLLAGFAVEDLAKGVYLRRKGISVADGHFPSELKRHVIRPLLDQFNIYLTPTEKGLVRRLETFVRWAGRYPVPLDVEHMMPGDLPEGGFGPPASYQSDDAEVFQTLFARLELLLLGEQDQARERIEGT